MRALELALDVRSSYFTYGLEPHEQPDKMIEAAEKFYAFLNPEE
jgi:hypothetical protein